MSLNLPQKITVYLKQNQGKKFTANEIAQWVLSNFPKECKRKQERSKATIVPLDNESAILAQIAAEIGSQRPRIQKNNSNIKTTEGRPRRYYYTEETDAQEVQEAESKKSQAAKNGKIKEIDLYPLLSSFLQSELSIYSKRIDEKRSRNNKGAGGNKWLYPDIVGMENLTEDWHAEIKNCTKEYSHERTKLWSFEVKVLINRSNIREVFFQAVSNSASANLGYLVASEIEGAETLKELRMLSGLHGIGLIKLDVENASESQIIIPAKERLTIDWDNLNRLVQENKDCEEFIKLVRQFYQTGNINSKDWDCWDEEF